MRRGFVPSQLSKLKFSKSFSRNVIFPFHSNQSTPSTHLKYFTHAKFHFFVTQNPIHVHYQPCLFHRAIQTTPAHFSHILSPQSQQPDLEDALDFSNNTEELLITFKALEATLSDNDQRLGLTCLKVGEILLSKGSKELEKALSFVIRALEILGRNDRGGSIPLVKALRLVGSISCKMKRFDESLESLETACQILDSLEEEGFSGKEFDSEKISIQLELANTKNAMGRRWDALINLRRSLQMRLLVLEPDSLLLASACKDVAEAYTGVLEFGEARPLCLKALGIFEAKIGKNCEEVVKIRQLLGAIHVGLGENEEALVQNELCQRILLSLNLETELLNMEIEAANIKVNLGRLGEAMSTLKGVIQKVGKESETRAFAFVSMAKALFFQERFGDSKGCLDMSCDILNKMDSSSEKVAEALLEISMLYEMMNEFETALSLMKRTLALLEKFPQEQYLMGSIFSRIGWLLLLTGRVQHAVPSLESAITKLKNSFGPKHFGLGFAYKHLGQAYLETDKVQSAIQMLLLAKDILEASFGPQHEDSIDTCQYIANAYGVSRSYGLAMEFQQEVINRWEALGPDAKNELREASRLLQQLKKKAEGSLSAVFPANNLPQHLQKSCF
ncbi:uncharacterized protein LOC110104874 [Dendrobium catenatum]|uniref:Uncharacterized protein n=1 Tax=Dendrobium catenatum TaxID=906689 RepID=A0A2I0X693_9ASPA|nr:uncharacterized protein LOC110104874 [Dendrobium catenatum]XP_020689811.1 uncharacterized protein LOC110104874 [Dendrobium catenatum]XP_020689812.1 uncharacterized protein LOC110104874 [Dendrobium catenatum]XP_028549296.1 uncharacterized protein LOC110104874 [Dendrobium catenatum]XP_028549297.1 uncharacterized protein LOC110104874 [Dendrobium catenatum]PKU83422.1 hypothetical protein MA16_Dca016531 [Dendrobium catenatum]